jgi:hypothetical protein
MLVGALKPAKIGAVAGTDAGEKKTHLTLLRRRDPASHRQCRANRQHS